MPATALARLTADVEEHLRPLHCSDTSLDLRRDRVQTAASLSKFSFQVLQ